MSYGYVLPVVISTGMRGNALPIVEKLLELMELRSVVKVF